MKKNYIYQNINIKDNIILDENGNAIMMEWERSIMFASAKMICHNKGDVLNIGFGMGIIDSFIQENNPYTHWIIEKHPQVIEYMKNTGWYDKKNVKILEGDWKDFIQYLPLFDGIYFDIWEDLDHENLFKKMSYIIKPNGLLSYFNSPKDGHLNLYPFTQISTYTDLIRQGLFYDYSIIDIENIKNRNNQRIDKEEYFPIDQKLYFNPIWTKKEKLIDVPKYIKFKYENN
jgi:SAM-dependent methyltransferase